MSETYNFGPVRATDKGYTVRVDRDACYGYWEYPSGLEGGGLWFGKREDGQLELQDYDGTSCLHPSIERLLCEQGYAIA
jgi:hypothetical protein